MDYMKKFSIPMSQPDITDEERKLSPVCYGQIIKYGTICS
jgi:hypothetical protein